MELMRADSRQRIADSGQGTSNFKPRATVHWSLVTGHSSRAQASMEMTVAMICAMLLMLGCFKMWMWMNQRLIARQQAYDASRVAAGSDINPGGWTDTASSVPLNLVSPETN